MPAQPPPPPPKRLLTLRQLMMLAVAAAVAGSGMVPLGDACFAALSLPYLYFLSVSFPLPSSYPLPQVFDPRERRILSAYVSVAAVVGILLPVVYILHGVLAGDREGIEAAAPHVFLLTCQVFMEGVTFNRQFSLPMRGVIPIFYNTRRLFTISDWLASEFAEEAARSATTRVSIGTGLAVANAALWAFNLFGFLLPIYLPRALKTHYSLAREEAKRDD